MCVCVCDCVTQWAYSINSFFLYNTVFPISDNLGQERKKKQLGQIIQR